MRTAVILAQKIMNPIKTFVFLDLETTGLPYMENNGTRITELTLVAVQNDHLSLGVLPRVQNKLSLCFNPRKLISYDAEQITGLSNFNLEHMSWFSSSTVQNINLFLDHNPKPICLVAHNGNRFDYPILRAEILKTGSDLFNGILCIDSLNAFRELHLQQTELIENEAESSSLPQDTTDSVPLEFQDGFDEILLKAVEDYETHTSSSGGLNKALEVQKINETTPKKQAAVLNSHRFASELEKETVLKRPGCSGENSRAHSNNKKIRGKTTRARLNFGVSFKLGDVYQRLTKSDVVDAHRAEGDVHMLLMCAATLGDKFIAWSNQNARNFCDIPPMTPGRRMGT